MELNSHQLFFVMQVSASEFKMTRNQVYLKKSN